MAVKEIRDQGASVLARLKNQSRETGLAYQMCLQLFAQEEFLRRLERSPFHENLVLKGGMFLYTLTNFEGRPTMDIDFLLRKLSNDLDSMKTVMTEICSVDTGNRFIALEVLGTERIAVEKEYPGIKARLRARIKNVRIPFSIDVGVDDVIVPGAQKRLVCTRLEGFEAPRIYTYSLESTIAEKLDAILKRMTATSRMKDFYDLYYLSHLFEPDGRVLREAIAQTLEHRKTPHQRNSVETLRTFCDVPAMQLLWKNYDPGAGLEKPEFDTVLEQICRFLEPVYASLFGEPDFFKVWSAAESRWIALSPDSSAYPTRR